jgi:hypothetical protein
MSVASGPYIATNGLVFAYDMGNPERSWEGAPTTNFYSNGQFAGGTGMPQEFGSNPTNTVISFPNNPGNSGYVLEQSMGVAFTEYQIDLTTQLLPSTTYVLSGWYAESPDYSCADGSRMFHCRAFSASGNNVALGTGIGTVITTTVINGITWKYCYATITTPSDYNNSFNWYVGYGGSSYTGKRYYTNLQMELGSYPSRFVDGTRSTTQALLDPTGQNTITATSLTYPSDGSFSFNGSTGYLSTPYTQSSPNSFTVEAWINSTEHSSDTNIGKIIVMPYSNYNGWIFSLNGTTSLLQLRNHNFNNSTISYNIASSSGLSLNTWYQIAATDDGTTVRLYVNGSQVASGSSAVSTTNSPMTLNIGAWPGAGSAVFFKGQIPQTKIYARPLTAAEVMQNFNAYRGRYGV